MTKLLFHFKLQFYHSENIEDDDAMLLIVNNQIEIVSRMVIEVQAKIQIDRESIFITYLTLFKYYNCLLFL